MRLYNTAVFTISTKHSITPHDSCDRCRLTMILEAEQGSKVDNYLYNNLMLKSNFFAGALNGRNLITQHTKTFPSHGTSTSSSSTTTTTTLHRRKSLETSTKLDLKSDTSSSGASPYMISSKVKKRDVRPITSRLERPTHSSLDLPHIHVPPQQLPHRQQLQQQQQQHPHLITNKLSRQLKLRGGKIRRSSSITRCLN